MLMPMPTYNLHTTTHALQVAIFDMMDPQARQDCLKEVKILQSLEHPNIVKCYNSFIQVGLGKGWGSGWGSGWAGKAAGVYKACPPPHPPTPP